MDLLKKYNKKTLKIQFNKIKDIELYDNITSNITSNIIFYHENCPDGTLACALWLKQIKTKSYIYMIQPSANITSFFPFKKFKKYNKINIAFLDVVPSDIVNFVIQVNKHMTNNSITIVDHHIGNTENVNKLRKYKNVIINFEPHSTFGATKQVIDILSKKKINY